MSGTSRKRQLSETYTTAASNKNSKIDQNVKENIPPDFSGAIHSYESNVNLHEIKTKITTPKKSRTSLKELPVTPSANVKLLATVAADCAYVECAVPTLNKNDETFDQLSCDSDSLELPPTKANRKEKSLAVICTRFLGIYPEYPPPNKKIIVSLDEVGSKLGVERRRLYDIVNVLESIDIVTKNAKNQYLWFGKNNLLKSLQKLQDAAVKEKMSEKLQYVLTTEDGSCKQSCILSEIQNFNKSFERPDSPILSTFTSSADMRREKSLGLMSQKFLMLFLVSPNKVISLGVAAKVLNGFLQRNERPAQIKTQVRRLYDVANVLSSIGLIQKETAFSHCVRKPAFKYIGPDLKDFKVSDNSADYIPKFQHIIEVAELEHKKLNMKEPQDSTPSTESISGKNYVKPSFQNLQLNKDASSKFFKNTSHMESKSSVTAPVFIQPSLKVVNVKSPETNPTVPCYILNNVSTDKSEMKNISMYGTQTFFILNPIATSKQVRVEPPPTQSNIKAPNQQIITLSSEQRDAILQSLNISLSSQQVAAIHLDGASQSNQEVPCNVLKIINKPHTTKVTDEKNLFTVSTMKDFESNSINNTRSSTPSSSTATSPLSIPSGYVTPIPNISSDISFISNTEVRDILQNIENNSKFEILNSKLSVTRQENEASAEMKINAIKATGSINSSQQCMNVEKKSVNTSLNSNFKNEISSSINQANQIISNDSFSSDSGNLEVSNILQGKSINDTLVKSKPFLIDEKTLLSPIKIPRTTAQTLVPNTLINLPHIVPETVFVFNTPTTSYQATKANNIPNIIKVVPNILSRQKSNAFIKLDNKDPKINISNN